VLPQAQRPHEPAPHQPQHEREREPQHAREREPEPEHQAKHHPKHQAPADPSKSEPLFRLHTSAHPAPPAVRVLGLASWAAICIFIGFIPAGRVVATFVLHISIFQGYAVTTASIGMLGVALIAGAFASIHRSQLPLALMSIATFLLMVNVAMVYTVSF
jgi:hypothetical protein